MTQVFKSPVLPCVYKLFVRFTVISEYNIAVKLEKNSAHISKCFAIVLLVLFIAIVFTPSVVTVVKENVDVSMFYSMVEEEEENSNNQQTDKSQYIKHSDSWNLVLAFSNQIQKIDFHREIAYTFVMTDQFCPPPELS